MKSAVKQSSPHLQVARLRLSIIDGDNVKVLLQSEGVKRQLYSVTLSCHYDPGTVGVVWVAVGKARTLYSSIEALYQAATSLT